MNYKYANVASILSLIGGIISLVILSLMAVGGTFEYIEGGAQIMDLFILIMLVSVPLIQGILGIIFSRKIKSYPTKSKGIILIIIGILSLLFLYGILFIISGIFTILSLED